MSTNMEHGTLYIVGTLYTLRIEHFMAKALRSCTSDFIRTIQYCIQRVDLLEEIGWNFRHEETE